VFQIVIPIFAMIDRSGASGLVFARQHSLANLIPYFGYISDDRPHGRVPNFGITLFTLFEPVTQSNLGKIWAAPDQNRRFCALIQASLQPKACPGQIFLRTFLPKIACEFETVLAVSMGFCRKNSKIIHSSKHNHYNYKLIKDIHHKKCLLCGNEVKQCFKLPTSWAIVARLLCRTTQKSSINRESLRITAK
jgi:hypothetical protein